MELTRGAVFATVAIALAVLGGCAQEEYPAALWEAQHASTAATSFSSAAAAPSSVEVQGMCRRAIAQPMPARLTAMSAQSSGGGTVVYETDLFSTFVSICGSCHGPLVDPPGFGGYQISDAVAFRTQMTKGILAHVMSNEATAQSDPASDPNDPMPPPGTPDGEPFSQRLPTDPVYQFAILISQWLGAGSPASFTLGQGTDGGTSGSDGGGSSPFALTVAAGDGLTNLGDCIPDPALVAQASVQPTVAALDAMFAALTAEPPGPSVTSQAQLIGLPIDLAQTDLVTLDTATLAQNGVIAYQPAYPLWSDDAGKLRYVRVPHGQSIRFDKASQEFEIPDNTRFYKTFLKRIADTDGSIRWRKIETRLIVARHDTLNPDGSAKQNALFGTYRWTADESDATLVETPLNDGLPFGDTEFLYNTDEQLAADVLAQNPLDPDQALVAAGAARHYGIPSSTRCVECHMGSPGQTFVLGFRPLQINRRPSGEGGTTIEPGQGPATADELSQLQRLIDYGVVTGIDNLSDVLPLEQSEGSRTPRNAYELVAQGYMVGNCAHCHNPRGYPSVQFPMLAPILSFLPGPTGGIFQFPLESYSPRINRSITGNTPIPYITPSLLDLSESFKASTPPLLASYAPWRSLIYRNVDTPFTYTDDYGLYPHMPMNTPGYDCRVKQIMSDWMVSIPATLKNSQSSEYTTFQAFASELTLPSCSDDSPCTGANQSCVGATATTQGKCVPADDTPQPYVEVMPGSPGYDDAVTSAQARLAILHTGINPSVSTTTTWSYYGYCPDTSDILDPAVVADPTCHPVPTGTQGPLSGQANGSSFSFTRSLAGINDLPDHAHWVITDTTQRPGPYAPRQGTWVQTLVQLQPEPVAQGCTDANLQAAQLEQQEVTVAVDLLQSASLADVNPVGGPLPLFATTPYPMGLWLKSSGCDFSSQHPVSWYDGHPGDAGDAQPDWLTNPAVTATVAPSDPVYAEWPGAAVFNLICVNCHGPNYDGTGRLADNLLTMTGGNTQVADLHDGLFGPVSNPGANRASAQAFGLVLPAPWDSVSVDDRAARYMAFMGLGGTDAIIPESILQIVGNTAILGVHIVQPSGLTTANMLSVAKYKCLSLLFGNMDDTAIAPDIHGTVQVATQPFYTPDPSTDGTFLAGDDHLLAINGDAELWMRLCSLDNPPPIRAVDFYGNLEYFVDQNLPSGEGFVSTSLFPQSAYSSAPAGPWTVGNDRSTGSGSVDTNGVAADNLRPWCLRQSALNNPPSGGDGLPASPPPSWWPICPPTIDDGTTVHNGGDNLPDSLTGEPDCTNGCWSGHDADRWAVRGAINAGLAVFLYLDALTKGTTTALPGYDACHSLP